MKNKKYYFTFGLGSPLKNRYQVVNAEDYDTARKLMIRAHGTDWKWQYTEKGWALACRNNPKMKELVALDYEIVQD